MNILQVFGTHEKITKKWAHFLQLIWYTYKNATQATTEFVVQILEYSYGRACICLLSLSSNNHCHSI